MTKKKVCTLTLALILLMSTAVWASTPFIQGLVSGIELCPQFICHAAIFVGGFQGIVGPYPQPQAGTISTAMTHTTLPLYGDPDATITGGNWELKTLFRRIGGDVVIGSIHANDNNTFDVTATLRVTNNGTGYVQFIGLLDHRPTIPRFSGALINIP